MEEVSQMSNVPNIFAGSRQGVNRDMVPGDAHEGGGIAQKNVQKSAQCPQAEP